MVALVVALGGASYSATGGNFILGQTNSASTQTKLLTPLAGAAFRVDNTSAAADATGITIATNAARPPLKINSSTKVANLNADLLDGIDATGFVKGGGAADGSAIALATGGTVSLGPALGGIIFLNYSCPASLASNGTLKITNVSTGIATVFVDNGGSNPTFIQLGAGGNVIFPAAAAGEAFSIRASRAGAGVVTIEVASVHRSSDCFVMAQQMVAS